MSSERELALTAEKRFPEATVPALWRVVELLRPALLCKRPDWNLVDCPQADPEWQGRDGENWCPACKARKVLEVSHQASLDLRVWQPPRLHPSSPSLTTRERVLVAAQAWADAWKRGTPEEQGAARAALYAALDVHEFWVADKAREPTPPRDEVK